MTDEPVREVLGDEVLKGLKLNLRKGVDGSRRRHLAFLEVDLEVVRTMRRERVGLDITEDVGELVVLRRNS